MKNLVLLLLASLLTLPVFAKKFPNENQMGGYLMVYFKDATHDLYIAISEDGYTFTSINGGDPIIAGDTIAEQKGIRDPYIMRGKDGNFYMALTDLHIFAQREGLRETEWQRDGKKYGWGNNRAIVLLKSKDLINWSHQTVRVDQAFPELEDIGCAWAPELIWDDEQNKIMMYFTIRYGNGRNTVVYTHMNKEFTAMESLPKPIFKYPKDVNYIDADITKVGNKYHMFYVPHDGTAGIKHAASDSLTSGYVYEEEYVDPEPRGCEAPNVFKRIGENKWVMVYDIYSIKPHNFGFVETTDFENYINLGHFNEGVMKTTNFTEPKHPAVIQITKKELKKLKKLIK